MAPGGDRSQQPLRRTRVVEAKTNKGKRFLEARAPQAIEYVKKLLLVYGQKTSQDVKDVMVDLKHLRDVTECVHLTRKNPGLQPFESGGETSLEFFANKSDCGAFIVGSTSKKRPNNFVMGRMYDEKLYDLMELGVKKYNSGVTSKKIFSPKPCFAFAGNEFATDPRFRQFKNFIVDAFRGMVVDAMNLRGIDRVIMCTPSPTSDNQVLLRHYKVKLKKSGQRIPRVDLEDVGPSIDFEFRRHREAPHDVSKAALVRMDEAQRKKKQKNVTDDQLEGTVGRLWLNSQNIDHVPLKKPKGRNRPAVRPSDE